MSGPLSMSLLPAKKCVLGRTALLPISMTLSACREGLDRDQVQALGCLIPHAHGSSLCAGRTGHRRAQGAHSAGCKLTERSVCIRCYGLTEMAVTWHLTISGRSCYSWSLSPNSPDVLREIRISADLEGITSLAKSSFQDCVFAFVHLKGPRWPRDGGEGRWRFLTTQKCSYWTLHAELTQHGKWGPCPQGEHQLSSTGCAGNKTLTCTMILRLGVSCC